MGVFWSIVTAVVYGTADFSGGLATRRERLVVVMFGAHGIGLLGVLIASLWLADAFTWRDFGLGAAGGLCGLVGVLFFYRRLALGPMQVVAPVSAVAAATTPALWGVVGGERLGGLAWLGVALALLAIVMVSVSGERAAVPVTTTVIAESLIAGLGFGLFFVFLDATEAATAPWPVTGGRTATFLLLTVYVLARRERISSDLGGWGLIAMAGLGDAGANVTFLWALETGDLVAVSVLSSLYPVSTVLLARAVLGERMTRLQVGGFVAAMTATGLIAAG